MPNIRIELGSLGLDEFGRVLLSDKLLGEVERCDPRVLAGAGGGFDETTNGSCTNSICDGSSNGWCTNQLSCDGASNYLYCRREVGGD